MKTQSILISLILLLSILACQTTQESTTPFERHADFPSEHIAPRHVDVHLPPGYDPSGNTRYPVLYMHDGQNLFTTETAYTGVEWEADETLDSLTNAGITRPCIIVGIWNTNKTRFAEYMPQEATAQMPDSIQAGIATISGRAPFSDKYLSFLTEELLPFINKEYLTLTGSKHTFIAGCSMGGLISLYALCKHPELFGGAACLSTHWTIDLEGRVPIMPLTLTNYFATQLPMPSTHKIYFDYGTKTLDAYYEPWQLRMDSMMVTHGYTRNVNWITKKFPGHDHSEVSWAKRFWEPMVFLLGQ